MSNSTAKSKTITHRIDQAAKSAHHVHEVAHDAKSAASRNGAQAAGKIKVLRERIQDGTRAAITKVKSAATSVRAKAARVDKTIRAKPYHSLGVAAGAGLVAGYLISRRRSNAS
jgi:ElaB/YqjD/DUF883 family membrane-anchored ribosome-binding protein